MPFLRERRDSDGRVHMATTNGRFCGAKRPECEADRPQAVAFIE